MKSLRIGFASSSGFWQGHFSRVAGLQSIGGAQKKSQSSVFRAQAWSGLNSPGGDQSILRYKAGPELSFYFVRLRYIALGWNEMEPMYS
jgi:hypothetical protein